jgi:hypothetical protein
MQERMLIAITAAGLLALATLATADDKLPEVDPDGLQLQKDTKVYAAYVKPGAKFEQFTKVMIADCYVDFVENWQRNYNLDHVGLSGRVTDKDAEIIKDRLAAGFAEIFDEQLGKAGYSVVNETGPDVLLLRPALVNVDVTAPDTRSGVMSRTYVRSLGSMTLYLELYDSSTNTLLARIIDPQSDDDDFVREADRNSNRIAAERVLRYWATLLTDSLDAVHAGN